MTFRLALWVVAVALAFLSTASPAYAYLDPGTGSMLVSAVIGVAAAVGLALKMFWYRLVGLFRGKKGGPSSGPVDGAPPAKE
jgi:NADH:ubiquinone oxidoreductase subunit K